MHAATPFLMDPVHRGLARHLLGPSEANRGRDVQSRDPTLKLEGTMNKLALATVMAVVWQAAGCIVETGRHHGDGGGGSVEVATISARWSLRNMLDGATTACPGDFDSVRLIMQPIDDNGDPVGDAAEDRFDCSDRAGVATDLFPDVYRVWIEIVSHDLNKLYAQSLSQVLDVRKVDETFTAEVLNDGGYFQIGWDLVGKATNRPVQCAQVPGLDTIKAISTFVSSTTRAYDDSFVCDDHFAVSGGLLQGSYTIAIDALDGATSVGRAAPLNAKIDGQNRVTNVGTIAIPIDGM
jgi:hypothetical protein